MSDAVQFRAVGDTALTVEFGETVDRAIGRRVIALRRHLLEAEIEGVVETVPTPRSLMVHFDPLATDHTVLGEAIAPLIGSVDDTSELGGRLCNIPVCYEGEHALDLAEVAEASGLSPREVVDRHSGIEHFVYMIGFAPGHPYLGDLDSALTLPRRTTPRRQVPQGTVAIATGLTVIYSFANPSGWHVIGRTPLPLFDLDRAPPAVLQGGDRVRFTPVDKAEFDRLTGLEAGAILDAYAESRP